MKNIVSIAFAALLALASCKSDPNAYEVSGTLEGLPDNTTLLLKPMAHTDLPAIDSCVVTNGAFTFKGSVEEPICVYIRFAEEGKFGGTAFMLEPGKTSVNGTVTLSSENERGQWYDFNATFTGSALTDEYKQKMSIRDEMDKAHHEMRTKFAKVSEAMGAARQAKNQAKIDSISATDEWKALMEAEHDFFEKVETSYKKLFEENKDSFWGPLLMINLYSYFTPENRKDYEALSQEAKDSHYGRMLKEELYPLGAPGDKTPEFTAKDDKGAELSLATVCSSNKYVLLDFWASWCGPCRKEIPNLKKIYADLHSKGLEILSVSIDKDDAAWRSALEAEQLPWLNCNDRAVADMYKVVSVPTMYVIDSKGCLVAENLRGEELAAYLADLLK